MPEIAFAKGSGFNAEAELSQLVDEADRTAAACGRLCAVIEQVAVGGMEVAETFYHRPTASYRVVSRGLALFFLASGPWSGGTEITVLMTARYGGNPRTGTIHREVRRRKECLAEPSNA